MKKFIKIVLFIILIITIIYFNAYTKKKTIRENMENIFLHGGPNTFAPDNYKKIDNLTKVNYRTRKSITGKYNVFGPEHSKESYKFEIKSCHCPPFSGPKENNIKTGKNYQQIYPNRLTTTAMFVNNGPLPNNEYVYDSFINGCNCPKYGVS